MQEIPVLYKKYRKIRRCGSSKVPRDHFSHDRRNTQIPETNPHYKNFDTFGSIQGISIIVSDLRTNISVTT